MGKGVGHRGSPVVRHSFVVRIWREEGRAEWRGWMQHAPTGGAIYLQDVTTLLAFIERRTGELVARPRYRKEKENDQ